jgi:predicted metalloprotease
VGDDSIQRRAQGYVDPDTFNHGTSDQRQAWFMKGFEAGDLSDWDTFDTAI